jgi:hypothetical protein
MMKKNDIPKELSDAVDARASMEASAQPGPRVEIHRETDGLLHVVIRCPNNPTETFSVKKWNHQDAFLSDTNEWINRHVLLAGCDCRDFLADAQKAFFEAGGTV